MYNENFKNESNEQSLLPGENKDLPTDHLLENSKPQKEKNKKKRHSATTAAALSRSAVGHAKSHTISNKPGDFAHSGTNISYDN